MQSSLDSQRSNSQIRQKQVMSQKILTLKHRIVRIAKNLFSTPVKKQNTVLEDARILTTEKTPQSKRLSFVGNAISQSRGIFMIKHSTVPKNAHKTQLLSNPVKTAMRIMKLKTGHQVNSAQDLATENGTGLTIQYLESVKIDIDSDVYNISVDEHEEYFANGILVHNCRYICMQNQISSATKLERQVMQHRENEEPLDDHYGS